MHLGGLLRPELILPELPGSDRPAVLREFSERCAQAGLVSSSEELYHRLWEREELGTTAIGAAVAIPHCKMSELDEVVVGIGVSRQGVDYESEDGIPVKVLFFVVSPEDAPAEHLQCLAAISKWVKTEHHVDRLLELHEPGSIWYLLQEES